MTDVNTAIKNYEDAINAALSLGVEMTRPVAIDETEAKVRNILVFRKDLSQSVALDMHITSDQLDTITRLDRKLKEDLRPLIDLLPESTLRDWRSVIGPAENAWWWFLDCNKPKPIPIWTILTVLFAIMAISLITHTTSLFFVGNIDLFKILSISGQAIIALIGATALTTMGRSWIERLLFKFGLRLESVNFWRAVVVFAVFLVALIVWVVIPPRAARYYNNRGYYFLQRGLTSRAMESFQRAIILDPDSVVVHYNLALAFEDIGEYERAIAEYRRAIALDKYDYAAYNNLAHLYLSQRRDYATALSYLKAESDLSPLDPSVRYSLFKNRGWANWGLKAYSQAVQDLKEAAQLAVDPAKTHYGAAAHCLLAQTLRDQGVRDRNAILNECEACIAYASDPEATDSVEAPWLNSAQQCLLETERK